MGMQLPAELTDVAAAAGVRWPEADETAMAAAADAWRDAGHRLGTLCSDADADARTALSAFHGEAADAARHHWDRYVREDGRLPRAIRSCTEAADRLDHGAERVAAAKTEIIRHLVILKRQQDAAHTAHGATGSVAPMAGLSTQLAETVSGLATVQRQLTQSIGLDNATAGQPLSVHGGDQPATLTGTITSPSRHGTLDGVVSGGRPVVDKVFTETRPAASGVVTGGRPAVEGAVTSGRSGVSGEGVLKVVDQERPGPIPGGASGVASGTVTPRGPVSSVTEPVVGDVGASNPAEAVDPAGTVQPPRTSDGPIQVQQASASSPVNPVSSPATVLAHPADGTASGGRGVVGGSPDGSGHITGGGPVSGGPVAGGGGPSGGFPGAVAGGPGAGGLRGGVLPGPAVPGGGPAAGAGGAGSAGGAGGGSSGSSQGGGAGGSGGQGPRGGPVIGPAVPGGSSAGGAAAGGSGGSALGAGARGGAGVLLPDAVALGGPQQRPGVPSAGGSGVPSSGTSGGATGGPYLGDPGSRAGGSTAGSQGGVITSQPGQQPQPPQTQQPQQPQTQQASVPGGDQGRSQADPRGASGGVLSRLPSGDDAGSALDRAAQADQAPDDPLSLFLFYLFPPGQIPEPTRQPASQVTAPHAELDIAAGLRFPPGDHPQAALVDHTQALAEAPREPLLLPRGRAADDELVQTLTAGHDPLGGLHEREWDWRFQVREPHPEHGVHAEYAWPPCEVYPEGGCDPDAVEPAVLEPGAVLDRFGDPAGRVLAADGTPFPQRSLPPEYQEYGYHRYRVEQPLPVWRTVSAAWFGQPGGGVRYRATHSVTDLVALGYLADVTTTAAAEREDAR